MYDALVMKDTVVSIRIKILAHGNEIFVDMVK